MNRRTIYYTTLILTLTLSLPVSAQRDTVRWFRQYDRSVNRTSSNPELSLHPRHDRKQLVVVEEYDPERHLVSRKTTIDEKCVIGNFFEFYENGAIRTRGEYLSDIDNPGDCGLKNGLWLCLSPKGDTTALEQWDRGKFSREIIRQEVNSLWAWPLLIDGKEFSGDNDRIDMGKKTKLSINFYYKNAAESGRSHVIRAKLTAGTMVVAEEQFSGNTEFNNFDFYKWCKRNFRRGVVLSITIIQSPGTEKLVGWYNVPVEESH